MKVVVVGAGILGAALAYRLSTEGVQVEVYESGRPGGGTSAVGTGWFNSAGKEPASYHFLNVSGMAEHATMAREFGHAPWYHPSGNMEWTSPDRHDDLRAHVFRLREWGYPAELLSPRRINEIEPFVRIPSDVREVAYYPLEGLADLPQLIGEFLRCAVANGVTVHTRTPVSELVTEGERVVGIKLQSGEVVTGDAVAVCTGRWSDELVATAGVTLPMAPTMGFNIYTGPAPVRLHGMVHTPDVNFRPEGAGRMLVRAADLDDTVDLDTPMDPIPPVGNELVKRVVQYLPNLDGVAIEGARVALRSIPADGLSVMGEVSARPGLYLLVTHSGGTMGPLLGRLMALEIAHGEKDPRLADFRPDRLVEA